MRVALRAGLRVEKRGVFEERAIVVAVLKIQSKMEPKNGVRKPVQKSVALTSPVLFEQRMMDLSVAETFQVELERRRLS